MRGKRVHPESGPSVKKTYYQTRGKVHLARVDPETPPELADAAWCGVKLEDCNHYTLENEKCTCQKCLMVMTGTWRKQRGGC